MSTTNVQSSLGRRTRNAEPISVAPLHGERVPAVREGRKVEQIEKRERRKRRREGGRCQSGTLHCLRTICAQDRSVSRAISQSTLIMTPNTPTHTHRRAHTQTLAQGTEEVGVCVMLSLATITVIHARRQSHAQPPPLRKKIKEPIKIKL